MKIWRNNVSIKENYNEIYRLRIMIIVRASKKIKIEIISYSNLRINLFRIPQIYQM